MHDAAFTRPDLTTFTGLADLGLEVTGQLLEPDRAVLSCRVLEPDDWCRRCGCHGVPRDTVTRRLAHVPFGWRPTTLLITVRRYRCVECSHVWRQDTTAAAEPRAKISRAGLRWGLVGIVVQHLSMTRIAEGLGVAWNTANDAVLAEGQRALIDDPARFDGVAVIGVDEHVWRHTMKRPGFRSEVRAPRARSPRGQCKQPRPRPGSGTPVLRGAASRSGQLPPPGTRRRHGGVSRIGGSSQMSVGWLPRSGPLGGAQDRRGPGARCAPRIAGVSQRLFGRCLDGVKKSRGSGA